MWGTCAGMVLLADRAQGGKAGGQALLGGMNVEVHRNYFGSQLASFEAPLMLDPSIADTFGPAGANASGAASAPSVKPGFTGIFIRAPAILSTGGEAKPIAWVCAPRQDAQVPDLPSTHAEHSSSSATSISTPERVIVAVQQGPFLVTAFHPELTGDHSWHKLFAQQVEAATGKKLLGQLSSPSITGSNSSSAHIFSDRNLTPGTSALSSFKHCKPEKQAAAAAAPLQSGLPSPVGLVGNDDQTGGHALSHAIAHRVICYPPTS